MVGPDTREWIVRAHDCAALGLHHIAHVGVADAAAPDPTLWSVVIVFVVAAVVILPSLGLLFYLDQKDLLQTVTEPTEESSTA